MKKKAVLLATLTLSACLVTTTVVLSSKGGTLGFAKDETYWYHYERVEPGEFTHGSKEFWANCSTHNYTLENPGVHEDIREGVAFNTTTYFAQLDSDDPRYIPSKAERVDIKGYFGSLLESLNYDPYSYIPNSMRPEYVTKVTEEQVTYDFTNFVNVGDIQYGGFGEQWRMVINNIKESQRFYNITNYGSEILLASNLLVSSFLDDYYDGTITKVFSDDSRFISKIDYHESVLKYNVQYLSGISVPLFGIVNPQIDMDYSVLTGVKTARIQLGDNNALKFVVSDNSYSFALEYGTSEVSRKAYFTVSRDETNTQGTIYEFIQYNGKELVPAVANFYIDNTYVIAVGNKASGLIGFTNYISELYKTSEGKMLGYEIQETKSVTILGKTYEVEFNTLWFNLNNISGINDIKIDNKVYVNDSTDEFKTKIYGSSDIKKSTSRRFDIEQRLQYFYELKNEEVVEHETSIPMMFVQEEKLSEFASDVHSENSYLTVSINLLNTYLTKIQSAYDEYVPELIAIRDSIDSEYIVDFIGNAAVIS